MYQIFITLIRCHIYRVKKPRLQCHDNFISKRNVEPPELRFVGDPREYNLSKLGLITLSLLPTKATVIRMLKL